ncbi:Uncharacterised protein [Mycobacterium tuberculosis]|nr:Uncharacterised protein [Mycobacterium tuberculosis]
MSSSPWLARCAATRPSTECALSSARSSMRIGTTCGSSSGMRRASSRSANVLPRPKSPSSSRNRPWSADSSRSISPTASSRTSPARRVPSSGAWRRSSSRNRCGTYRDGGYSPSPDSRRVCAATYSDRSRSPWNSVMLRTRTPRRSASSRSDRAGAGPTYTSSDPWSVPSAWTCRTNASTSASVTGPTWAPMRYWRTNPSSRWVSSRCGGSDRPSSRAGGTTRRIVARSNRVSHASVSRSSSRSVASGTGSAAPSAAGPGSGAGGAGGACARVGGNVPPTFDQGLSRRSGPRRPASSGIQRSRPSRSSTTVW